MNDDEHDLSLVPTQRLLSELADRHDAILIVGQQMPTNDASNETFSYCGTVASAIGLAELAKARIIRDYMSDGRD